MYQIISKSLHQLDFPTFRCYKGGFFSSENHSAMHLPLLIFISPLLSLASASEYEQLPNSFFNAEFKHVDSRAFAKVNMI